jgi:hypothetical protein
VIARDSFMPSAVGTAGATPAVSQTEAADCGEADVVVVIVEADVVVVIVEADVVVVIVEADVVVVIVEADVVVVIVEADVVVVIVEADVVVVIVEEFRYKHILTPVHLYGAYKYSPSLM